MSASFSARQTMIDRGLLKSVASLEAFRIFSQNLQGGNFVKGGFVRFFWGPGAALDYGTTAEVVEMAVIMCLEDTSLPEYSERAVEVFLPGGFCELGAGKTHDSISTYGVILGFLRSFTHIKQNPESVGPYVKAICKLIAEVVFHRDRALSKIEQGEDGALTNAIAEFVHELFAGHFDRTKPQPDDRSYVHVLSMMCTIDKGMANNAIFSNLGKNLAVAFAHQVFNELGSRAKIRAVSRGLDPMLLPALATETLD